MSDYPRLRIVRASTADRQGGVQAERATNGALKVRRLWPDEKTDFVIDHVITRDERTALEAYYQLNKDLAVNLFWPDDGATYSVCFAGPPQYVRRGDFFEARVRLMQV